MIDPTRYLEATYRRGGRAWPAVDCWGLYRQIVADATGVWLNEFSGLERGLDAARMFAGEADGGGWAPVAAGDERPLDAVLMRGLLRAGGTVLRVPMHVGCVVEPGRMLHIEGAAGPSLQCFDGRGRPELVNRVVGLFRPAALGGCT